MHCHQHNTKITKRLPNSTSIYSAEAKTKDLVLTLKHRIHQIHHFFFSDSLSVLTSLKHQNLDNPLTMQLLNRLEILSKTKDRPMLDPKPHWNQRDDQADSAAMID